MGTGVQPETKSNYRDLISRAHYCIFILSGSAAFLLRFDFYIPAVHIQNLAFASLVWLVVKSLIFRSCGLNRGWWQFVSVHELGAIAKANLLASIVAAGIIQAVATPGIPASIYFLDLLICSSAAAGIRLLTRLLIEHGQEKQAPGGTPTLIYGAGRAGVILWREIRSNPETGCKVYGFIDDNPHKHGMHIQNVPVLGPGARLSEIVSRHKIEQILIAIPSAVGTERMREVFQRCQEANVRFRTMPPVANLIEGRALVSQIRDVNLEDLLGRNPVQLHTEQIAAKLRGKIVLVTGAGGSIGSELCRQIARFHPGHIIGFESSENALFELDLEMRQSFPGVPFHPEIGNIQNEQRLAEVLAHYRPSILYHAAAYKHVPMMEKHVFEAVENNIFGTYKVATAAAEARVEDFVMISSDKAVRPTNVMGATKRIAELVIRSLPNGATKYVSVRFGNVLGSNGSVVPLFQRQIAAGGPVTVTHPEMERYFMTIPEASQLVLQASAMGKGGEIFVLNMGAPVRILDLARNLILLSGKRPGQDVQIEFCGIRPGEKLFEELRTLDEGVVPTHHSKIRIFLGSTTEPESIMHQIRALRRACSDRHYPELIELIQRLVPEYNASENVRQRLGVPVRPSSSIDEHVPPSNGKKSPFLIQ